MASKHLYYYCTTVVRKGGSERGKWLVNWKAGRGWLPSSTIDCRADSAEEAGDHGAGSGEARSRTDYGEDGGGNGAGGAGLECVQYDEDPEAWNR